MKRNSSNISNMAEDYKSNTRLHYLSKIFDIYQYILYIFSESLSKYVISHNLTYNDCSLSCNDSSLSCNDSRLSYTDSGLTWGEDDEIEHYIDIPPSINHITINSYYCTLCGENITSDQPIYFYMDSSYCSEKCRKQEIH